METASNCATNLSLPVALTPAPLNPASSDPRGPVLSEHVRPETGPQAEGSGACEASDIPVGQATPLAFLSGRGLRGSGAEALRCVWLHGFAQPCLPPLTRMAFKASPFSLGERASAASLGVPTRERSPEHALQNGYASRTSIFRVLITCLCSNLCGDVNNEPEGALETLVKHFVSFEPHSCHMLDGWDCSLHLEFRVNFA